MPYKSKAQHRLFRVLESQGKLPPGKASEWYHETKHPKRLPDHKGDPVKERLRDKAQKMYAQGKSVSQVARALGVQESTAEKWRWAGGVTRKSTRRDPERKWDSGGQTWYVEYRVVRRGKVERANLRQEVYAYTSDEALSKTKGYAQADWEADSIYPLYVATVPSSRASESVRNQAMVTAGRWAKRASGVKGMWL